MIYQNMIFFPPHVAEIGFYRIFYLFIYFLGFEPFLIQVDGAVLSRLSAVEKIVLPRWPKSELTFALTTLYDE